MITMISATLLGAALALGATTRSTDSPAPGNPASARASDRPSATSAPAVAAYGSPHTRAAATWVPDRDAAPAANPN